MSEGYRDAFVENDVIGNYNVGTDFLGSVSNRKSRRKTKKRRKASVSRRSHKRHSRRRKVSPMKRSKKGRKYPHWLKKYWFKKKRK